MDLQSMWEYNSNNMRGRRSDSSSACVALRSARVITQVRACAIWAYLDSWVREDLSRETKILMTMDGERGQKVKPPGGGEG